MAEWKAKSTCPSPILRMVRSGRLERPPDSWDEGDALFN
jgi:hypothetical protein